jgi:hypothetical protein
MTELDGQRALFEPPLMGVSLVVWHEPGYGWSLRAQQRREGGAFAPGDTYVRLTRGELLDVLLEVAIDLLEMRD